MKNRLVKAGDPIILQNDRLKVEIAYPGSYYSGSRFDWNGFITQVTLNGRHTFCVPERYEPGKGTGGAGLCNEFGISLPVSFDDAKPGEFFPKFGTGLLKRDSDKAYDFFHQYEVDPFHVFITADGINACFKIEPEDCRGYAVRLQKTLSIKDNMLSINYKFLNAGSKQIKTNEYCHNFLGIDGQNIGRDYCLSFPRSIAVNRTAGSFVSEADRILWEGTPQTDFYGIITGELDDEPWKWQLVHLPSGAGIRETSRISVSRFVVWGSAHVVSPELFVDISLMPGETMEWTREYEFFCKD